MTILDFVRTLHDQSVELAHDLKFNKSFRADGLIVCLYATLIEHTGSFLTLVDKKQKAGSSAIFRSFLEAYVDFVNLNKEPKYINYCYAKYHKEWIKVLKASMTDNPYLKGIGDLEYRDKTLREHQAELNRLAKEKFEPLSVFDRFHRAGMENEYRSIYNFESSQAHNDIRALIDRHLEKKDDDFGIVLYEEVSVEDFATHLDNIAGLLLSATRQLHKRLKTNSDDKLTKLDEALTTVRAAYA